MSIRKLKYEDIELANSVIDAQALKVIGLEANQTYLYNEIESLTKQVDTLKKEVQNSYLNQAWYLAELSRLR